MTTGRPLALAGGPSAGGTRSVTRWPTAARQVPTSTTGPRCPAPPSEDARTTRTWTNLGRPPPPRTKTGSARGRRDGSAARARRARATPAGRSSGGPGDLPPCAWGTRSGRRSSRVRAGRHLRNDLVRVGLHVATARARACVWISDKAHRRRGPHDHPTLPTLAASHCDRRPHRRGKDFLRPRARRSTSQARPTQR